ncbi:MAG: extracellular solute-binding protein [Clostridiales bacterium]|nr:extracellular solute-binding protein [Clostridiales bacterium]
MKKVLSLTMAILISVTVAFTSTACQNRTGETVKEGYTPLYVNVLSCGVGTAFAESLEDKFEAMCEAEGKKVDVIITTNDVNGNEGITAVRSGASDIFYFNGFDISYYTNLAEKTSNAVLDITDIVTEGGEDSIYNRLQEVSRNYFNVGTDNDPKFFALPWFSSYYGTVYDVELFRENHYYRNDPNIPADSSILEYTGLDGITGNEDDAFGPDGVENTVDDGLPATWNDFRLLLEQMQNTQVKPFAFTMQGNYTEAWLYSLWASYEGASNIYTMTNFSGDYKSRNAQGGVDTLEVTPENAYMMSEQTGKLAALEIAKYLVESNSICLNSYDSASENNLEAQKTYLRSFLGKNANKDGQRIAFLMEGTWWENEAKDYFGTLVGETKDDSLAYGTREFGFMPFPKFINDASGIPDQVHNKTVMRSSWVSNMAAAVMISKNSAQPELAKKFLKLAYSEEMNGDFTLNSGVTVPMEYTMTKEQLSKITPFQKNIFELVQSPYVEVVEAVTRSEYMLSEPDVVKTISTFAMATSETTSTYINAPIEKFKENMSVETYWQGIQWANPAKNWANMPWMK